MLRKTLLLLCSILMLVVSSLLSLVVIEILLRKIDGYPLLPVTLGAIPQPQKVLTSQNSLRDYLKKIPLPDDIDTDWFMLNPQPLPPKPADPF
jgi:hypothetical protein